VAAVVVYALYAAWRQSPAGATLGVVASVGLKLRWLGVPVAHDDRRAGRSDSRNPSAPFLKPVSGPANTQMDDCIFI